MRQVALFDQQQVQSLLDTLEFFDQFTAEEKKRFLALQNHFVAYDPGERLIQEGTADASFFVLLWGKVNVTKGDSPRPLASLQPGEFFGEVTFLTNTPRTANVVADGKVLAIKVDQKMLAEMDGGTREKIKDKIIQRLVQRLDAMNKALEAIPS